MANPKGNLSGWSDPKDPEFLDKLFARRRADASWPRGRRGRKGVTFDAMPAYWDLLRQAVKKRGITRVSYLRRAVAAFIAHDLDLPLEQVLTHTPQVIPPRVVPTDPTHDDGTGYGLWRIKELEN